MNSDNNLPEPHSKKIRGGTGKELYELRVKLGRNICRLFYFYWKDKIYVITSGYMKKTDKINKREILKAVKIMKFVKEEKMAKIKTINSEKLLIDQMRDNNFRIEYERYEREFAIAKQIIKLRKKRNLTQKQLAELSGTSQPAIARLESGEYKNFSISFLKKIGKALGVIPEINFIELKKSI